MRSILVIVAHPDDETMLSGGTIALLSEQGIPVHLLTATRGEGGEVGAPPLCSRESLGEVREHELRCAAEHLGVATLNFMGYQDPVVGPDDTLFPFEADYSTLVNQIRDALRETDAEAVITHGTDGEYGHPAHQLLHCAVADAVQRSSSQPLFYTFAAHIATIEDRLWNVSDPAHLILDVRPWLDAKEAAAMCHETQHVLFKRRLQAETVREILRTTESFHRHVPLVDNGTPTDAFADLLRAAGAWSPQT